MIEREREAGRDTGGGRSRLQCRETDVGLDPGTPGSCPGPKAGAKPLSYPEPPRDPPQEFFKRPLCSM